MRARMIGLVTVAALVTPTLAQRPSIAAATTARVWVTGYVDRGYTASGVYTHPGTCAVDPRVIPLGTYITVDGLWTCHAEDTGSAVIGYHVDLWVPTVAEAYAITGWRMASWDTGSQQVLGYRAAAPTATATSAPPPPTFTPVPPTWTPAPPTFTPIPPTTPATRATAANRTGHTNRARRASARKAAGQATPTAPISAAVAVSATPMPGATTTPPDSGVAGSAPPTPAPTYGANVGAAPTAVPPGAPTTVATTATPLARANRTSRYQGECRTTSWTVYVAGHPYRYWRTVCH